MAEVVFSKKAQKRLIEAALYVFEKSGSAEIADAYLEKLEQYVTQTLSHFPQAGRPCEEFAPGVRKLVYQGFSFLYRIQGPRIEILTLYRENLP